ncbi:MAG: UbiA family prenyltransferase [Planctomycetota bacterium]
MKAWLRLARVPFAFTAATDALAVGLLAHVAVGSDATTTRWPAVLGAAVLVYAFGMMLNDWADRTEDALHADRPLPSGALRPTSVAMVILLVAAGALALAISRARCPPSALPWSWLRSTTSGPSDP